MKIISEKVAYQGKFISVKEADFVGSDGTQGVWEIVKRNTLGIVSIFALTKNREVILERIFRVPMNGYVIELPSGLMDKKGEMPKETVIRELREETGYVVNDAALILQGAFNAGLVADEIMLFFAREAEKGGDVLLESAEDITVITVPIDNFIDFILNPPVDSKVDVKVLSLIPILKMKGLI